MLSTPHTRTRKPSRFLRREDRVSCLLMVRISPAQLTMVPTQYSILPTNTRSNSLSHLRRVVRSQQRANRYESEFGDGLESLCTRNERREGNQCRRECPRVVEGSNGSKDEVDAKCSRSQVSISTGTRASHEQTNAP